MHRGPELCITLSTNAEAADLVASLGLVPLPREGGYFASTWTSPVAGPEGRSCASAILFLITAEDFSALHRLDRDEVWSFSGGDPAELVRLDPRTGADDTCILGPEPVAGHRPQATVASGVWQGARIAAGRLAPRRGWTLVSCVVAPAWDERAFELADRDTLIRVFPSHAELIRALTR
ncbi:MAG TPA: cupin domain-containing protein [Opitutaceae bacterium]